MEVVKGAAIAIAAISAAGQTDWTINLAAKRSA
jgi:hypothetical protein